MSVSQDNTKNRIKRENNINYYFSSSSFNFS